MQKRKGAGRSKGYMRSKENGDGHNVVSKLWILLQVMFTIHQRLSSLSPPRIHAQISWFPFIPACPKCVVKRKKGLEL